LRRQGGALLIADAEFADCILIASTRDVMPVQIWAEAAARKHRIDARSEAAGYAAGIMTWVLAGSVFVAVKIGVTEMPL
jgi:hypothetical protein